MVKCGMQPEDAGDVADTFADEFGITVDVLTAIDAMKISNSTTDREDVKSIYDRFMRLVEEASATIDKLEIE